MSSKSPQTARTAAPRPARSKRAQTRERLLDIAARLFAERGISAVSLDEVAAHAGLTKGAIYGSFAGKDDLVFAVAAERIRRPLVAFDDSAPVREQLRALVKTAFGARAQGRGHFAFLTELDLYALTREDLAARFVATARQRHHRSAELLAARKDELALPPLQFAVVAQSLLSGLVFQHACFPDIVTEETAMAAFESLLK